MKTFLLAAAAGTTISDVDIHLVLMAGLVLLAGLGAALTILLLLLLAPVLHLTLGHHVPRKGPPGSIRKTRTPRSCSARSRAIPAPKPASAIPNGSRREPSSWKPSSTTSTR